MLKILQNKNQIAQARKELIALGASTVESWLFSTLRKIGLVQIPIVGDILKSWDVLETLEFIRSHVKPTEPILDIGCYASEIIIALCKLGYTNLIGVDLNSGILQMPYRNIIRYEKADFKRTAFQSASFKAITSISVIEHDFDGESLLKEVSRLLLPDGYFVASFDYWPERIDTTNIKIFNMDWKIFSENDVIEFVRLANVYGLCPVGMLSYKTQECPIECEGKRYTFAWLVLRKK